MKEKVVLAYSGGLDTTAIIPWLKETFDYEVICCCIDCGQGNELVGLDNDSFDFSNNSFIVTRKGGNNAILYFSDEVKYALEEYIAEKSNDEKVPLQENAFFLSMQYKRINVRSVEILVKKYSSIVTPLKKITPHKLRSTYGTRLYNETGDIYIVADVLGHKDVNTTKKHYAAISEDNRKKVADAVKLRQEPDDTPPGDKN